MSHDLLAALTAHQQASGAIDDPDGAQARLRAAACRVLVWAHAEPGSTVLDRTEAASLQTQLGQVTASPNAEARVSQLWLSMCLGESATADTFEALVREPLHPPFRSLTFRALAFLGQRRLLMSVLPGLPSALDEADARLDAGLSLPATVTLSVRTDQCLAPDIAESWESLLRAEVDLDEADSMQARATLRRLAALAGVDETGSYDQAVGRRIATRAAAALLRASLAWGGDETATVPALPALPDWERAYLDGLRAWQRGDRSAARVKLLEALAANPAQTGVRVAASALKAQAEPDEALGLLQTAEPTRQMLGASAALLARLHRYDQAHEALAAADRAPDESIRQSGSRWRRRCRRQEKALRAALAERRGDWHNAVRNHIEAFQLAPPPTPGRPAWLEESRETQRLRARRLFLDARRVRLFQGPAWIREQHEALVDQGDEELSAAPLAGDARFFRALAMVGRSPDRSMAELTALFDEPGWIDRERSAGGDRILMAADALLSLGQADLALRGYEAMPRPWSTAVHDRRAVALVYREFARHAKPDDVTRAARAVKSFAPANFWPQVFAALAHVVTGQSQEGDDSLMEAKRLGAPESVCDYLRAVGLSREGQHLSVADVDSFEFSAETQQVLAALCPAAAGPDALKGALKDMGDSWVGRFLLQPRAAARQMLSEWCQQGRTAEACDTALRLLAPRGPLPAGFVAWLCLRRAVESAARGKWQDADTYVGRAETLVSP